MTTAIKNGKEPPVKGIRVTNIRGVKHIDLGHITRHLIVIGGMNGSGKTSFATAIRATVGGMRGVESLLRDGAQIGGVVLDLGDRKIVRTAKRAKDGSERGSVEVITADGPEQKPQERLDRMVRSLSFDPMAFFAAHPHDQVRQLLEAVGIDYAALDLQITELEQERVIVGRQRDNCKGALAKYPPVWTPPESELSAVELSQQMSAALRQNSANAERRRQIEARDEHAKSLGAAYQSAKADHVRLLAEEGRIIAELERMQRALEETRRNIEAAVDDIACRKADGVAFMEETEALKASLADLEDIDTAEIETQIGDIEQHNSEYKRGQDRRRHTAELEQFTAAWNGYDRDIQAIHQRKRQMLAEADFPVKGLEIGERGITLEGRTVSVLNTAEQLKLALAIAYANVNKDLPLVILDQAERLDPSQLEIVRQMAEGAGVVTLAMRVATDGTCSVVLDQGQVVGAEQWADEVLNGPLEVGVTA